MRGGDRGRVKGEKDKLSLNFKKSKNELIKELEKGNKSGKRKENAPKAL